MQQLVGFIFTLAVVGYAARSAFKALASIWLYSVIALILLTLLIKGH